MSKLQFRVLFREFLFRVVDLELLTPQGDMLKLLGQFAALLISISLGLSFIILTAAGKPRPTLAGLIFFWIMEHFLIATTMLVVGLFAVLSWDSTFPDRRDVVVLAPLPVRTRTMFLAKVTAVGTALGLTIVALNMFIGIAAPLAFSSAPTLGGSLFHPIIPRNAGFLAVIRSFAAYWITMLAAGIFMFCCVLTIQGLLQLLPRQKFLRASSFLQLTFFVLLLTIYFLQPPFTELNVLFENRATIPWVPSYWFFALFQQLSGLNPPAFVGLARRAWLGLGAAVSGAGAAYLICYFRTLRMIAEQPDIYLLLLGLLSVIVAELSLHGFQKIPFTCSYLPGKSHFHMVTLAFVGLMFLTVKGAELERASFDSPVLFVTIAAICIAAAGVARWRTSAQAKSEESIVQFEDLEIPVIQGLGLHRDGGLPVEPSHVR